MRSRTGRFERFSTAVPERLQHSSSASRGACKQSRSAARIAAEAVIDRAVFAQSLHKLGSQSQRLRTTCRSTAGGRLVLTGPRRACCPPMAIICGTDFSDNAKRTLCGAGAVALHLGNQRGLARACPGSSSIERAGLSPVGHCEGQSRGPLGRGGPGAEGPLGPSSRACFIGSKRGATGVLPTIGGVQNCADKLVEGRKRAGKPDS